MIKIFFTCSWDSNPEHFLKDKYLPLTKNNSGIWKNIKAVTNIKEADWLIIVDDINKKQKKEILNFNRERVICIPREPARKNPNYLNYDFKYRFTYENFFHCWTSIMCIGKNYDELSSIIIPYNKKKICSTITSKLNLSRRRFICYKNRFYKKIIQTDKIFR